LSCQFAIEQQANAWMSALQFKAIAFHILYPTRMTDVPNNVFLINGGCQCGERYLTFNFVPEGYAREMALSRIFKPQSDTAQISC
jgi:hypothetical protein